MWGLSAAHHANLACLPRAPTAHCHTQVRAAAALSNIKQVNEEELEVIVGSTIEKPTVIDFYATWCGPCLLLAQELEKVSSSRPCPDV